MRIAILGWGSLLWDKHPDFDGSHDDWVYDGPTLKLEFSRVSTSRLGALTLVVDEDNGTPTSVAWCCSKRCTLEDALCDLRCRESTTLANIGRIVVGQAGQSPNVVIREWAQIRNLDAVIWTSLKSNFNENGRPPYSVQNAISYLKNLKPDAKSKAVEYVLRAPDFVKTQLRTALEADNWFSNSEQLRA